jgi:hypothetical protein
VTVDGSVGNKVQITAYGHGGDDNLDLTVGGVFSGNATADGAGVAPTDFVTLGSINNGGLNLADAVVKVFGNVTAGFIKGGIMDLAISGNVDSRTTIQTVELMTLLDDTAAHIVDGSADHLGFWVGGNFNGRLDTGILVTGINMATLTPDAAATLVAGTVSNSGLINVLGVNVGAPFGIVGLGGADTLFFGKGMGGQLTVNALSSNLTVLGDASKITITSPIITTIDIAGKLAYLRTGSLFDATSKTTGDFEDGADNTTGSLVTTKGWLVVTPTGT